MIYAPAVLVLAGLFAGIVGTAGGITSIVSYPALLLVGLSRFSADVVNLVAAVACWPGAALVSRTELAGQRPRLLWALPAAAAGAVAGALLLLSTPPSTFDRIVPLLVLSASASLAVQPWLTERVRRHRAAGAWATPTVGVVSVYGGYFGAGSGVMLLSAWLIIVDDQLHRANAAKNMLVGASSVAAAIVVVAGGSVAWSYAAPLGLGMFVGSTIGPRVTRRLPPTVTRWLVIALGVVLALQLWL